MHARHVPKVEREEKGPISDPGSELRPKGREKRRANKWDGKKKVLFFSLCPVFRFFFRTKPYNGYQVSYARILGRDIKNRVRGRHTGTMGTTTGTMWTTGNITSVARYVV